MKIKAGQKVRCRACAGDGVETRYRRGTDNEPVPCPIVCRGCDGTGDQEVAADATGTQESRYEGVTSAIIEQ